MKKKGKGLSFDQKRERMLTIFHKTVYFPLLNIIERRVQLPGIIKIINKSRDTISKCKINSIIT